MSVSTVDWAVRYIQEHQFKLVAIPRGTKGPTEPGWNKPGRYITDPAAARQRWNNGTDEGIGVVLSASGLCSGDIDFPEHAEPVLGDLGVDLRALRQVTPTIRGNPARYRIMFQAPPGVVLQRKVLVWPARKPGEKPPTVFELRAGDIQDVLPPTQHPDFPTPYTWLVQPNGTFPPLPEALLELWLNWSSYEPELKAMCPWAKNGFKPEPAPRGAGARPSVIAAFNRVHTIEELLEAHGYTRRGERWISPTSSSGLAGAVIFDDGKVYSHHTSDPLFDGHAHDAFDVYRILDHGGDTKSAVRAAAEELGIESEVPRGPQSGNSRESPAPEFISAPTLWRMRHAPTRWAVPGILPEGVTLLGGKPKTGKSWMAIQLGISTGAGGRALGAIDVEAGPVLYLALEDNKRRLTKRLRILCGAIPPAEQIKFLTDCPRLGSGGEKVLRAWLQEHPTARLIVIDTLQRFRPHANARENPYANDYAVGETMR